MALGVGIDVGCLVLELLGIDYKNVKRFQLNCAVDTVPEITLTQYLEVSDETVTQRFAIVPMDDLV